MMGWGLVVAIAAVLIVVALIVAMREAGRRYEAGCRIIEAGGDPWLELGYDGQPVKTEQQPAPARQVHPAP